MASSMRGARGRVVRCPRWASHILGRLPLLVLVGFLLSARSAIRAETAPESPSEDNEVASWMEIWSCEDLPDARTEVYGIVDVLGNIICPETRIIRVSKTIGREVAFVSESPISTKGVQFEVPTNTKMMFGAPTLNFEKAKDSTQEIFSVRGSLGFFADLPLPVPDGSTPEDKHSLVRVEKGGSIELNADLHFTDSSLTVTKGVVEPDPIIEGSRWATRSIYSLHQDPSTEASPLISMFGPPFTTRESSEERLLKSPMYIKAGDEVIWPSTMTSEDGTVLTLGVDGSLLIKKQAAAAGEGEGDPLVVQPLVTLIAADFRSASRALEKRLTGGEKSGSVGIPGRKEGVKVPGGAGWDGKGRTILTVTNVGDVEVLIDGKRVLHKTDPNIDLTWRRKIWDRVRGRERPKGNYEMHLVSNGFEVRLDGATVWGVHSDDLPPVPS